MTSPLDCLAHLPDFCQNHPDKNLYLAVSGGRDSMALAYGCYLLYKSGELPVLPTLLHVHHGMQSANDDWANLVENWAGEMGFDCRVLRLNLTKKTETTARDARYQAMANCMNDKDVLLLAHHMNDQAETLLMRLASGAGVSGMSGIKMWQDMVCEKKHITLHRPFLSVSREDITDFASHHRLPYVDDPTNDTADNDRSFIRNEVLPSLAKLNPKVVTSMVRTAELMQDAYQIIGDVLAHQLSICQDMALNKFGASRTLSIDKLKTLSPALLSAVLHKWLQGDEGFPPNRQLVALVMALVLRDDGDHQSQIFWQGDKKNQPDGYIICRYQNTVFCYNKGCFELLKSPVCHDLPQSFDTKKPLILKQNDTHALIFLGKKWGYGNFSIKKYHGKDELLVQMAQTVDKKVIKKLGGKKLFQTIKIPAWCRASLWVLCHDDTPVALIGLDFGVWLDGADHEMKQCSVEHLVVCQALG